jgi:hypothetical protein
MMTKAPVHVIKEGVGIYRDLVSLLETGKNWYMNWDTRRARAELPHVL